VDGAGDRTAFEIFLSVVASVPVARAWVGQRMRWLAVQEEVCERVQLLVSELAANAVRHTSSTLFEVHLSLRQEILEVAVHDQDPSRQPQLRRPLPRHTHGRGLAIVDALSDRWGTRRSPAGKSIWFHIDTTLP
jgi:anti-sigma regulatory factor (Ser/Thr protein kinase)